MEFNLVIHFKDGRFLDLEPFAINIGKENFLVRCEDLIDESSKALEVFIIKTSQIKSLALSSKNFEEDLPCLD